MNSILNHTIKHKADACSVCSKVTETTDLRINTDDGFCKTSFTVYVGTTCCMGIYESIGDTEFVKLGKELFYLQGWTLAPVKNLKHFYWLRDERLTNNYLQGVQFSDDCYKDL